MITQYKNRPRKVIINCLPTRINTGGSRFYVPMTGWDNIKTLMNTVLSICKQFTEDQVANDSSVVVIYMNPNVIDTVRLVRWLQTITGPAFLVYEVTEGTWRSEHRAFIPKPNAYYRVADKPDWMTGLYTDYISAVKQVRSLCYDNLHNANPGASHKVINKRAYDKSVNLSLSTVITASLKLNPVNYPDFIPTPVKDEDA